MAELPWPSPPLADSVVGLRPWRVTDIPARLRAFTDPAFERFSDEWPPHVDEEAHRQLSEQEEARLRGEKLWFALVACDDEDRALGGISLYDVTLGQGRATVGYWIAPEARGQGFATRGVRLVSRWAFEELGVARLELTCGPDNFASQRVAERCGFRREGLLRSHLRFKDGRPDTVVYGLLAGELLR